MSTTDLDARRVTTLEPETESLDVLQERRAGAPADDTDPDFTDSFELPGYDILDEELSVPVVPMKGDEFRCGSCFLVRHRTQHAGLRGGHDVCRECA